LVLPAGETSRRRTGGVTLPWRSDAKNRDRGTRTSSSTRTILGTIARKGPSGPRFGHFEKMVPGEFRVSVAQGAKKVKSKIYPRSAKIIVRRLDGRMDFVPEGQHDSSQARNAWNREENSLVPAGRLNRSQLRSNVSHRNLVQKYLVSEMPEYNRPWPTPFALSIFIVFSAPKRVPRC
jgi:hypothetical protein